ncbi:MAG: PilN domain-containing protein [bacterium]
MIKINLLPAKAVKRDSRNREFVIISVVALVAVAAVIIFLSTAQAAKLQAREDQITKLKGEIEELQRKVKEVDAFKAKQEKLRQKIGIIEQLRKQKTGPVRVLDDLSMKVPEEVWIIKYSEEGGQIRIVGNGIDDESISQFLQKLEASPYFNGVELLFIKPIEINKKRVRNFEITAHSALAAPPPKPAPPPPPKKPAGGAPKGGGDEG